MIEDSGDDILPDEVLTTIGSNVGEYEMQFESAPPER